MPTKIDAMRYAIGDSALGLFAIAASGETLAALLFGETREELQADLRRRFAAALREDASALAPVLAAAQAMIASPATPSDLTLAPQGTEFQHRVWDALRQIPPGATASYGEVAQRIGAPRAMRAVAQACGANPIAVAIPCHRVVRGDGAVGGYRWGVARKAMLLRAEAAL